MACLVQQIFFLLLTLLVWTNASNAQKPKALVLPITKDSTTLQYLTRLSIGTPQTQKTFVVDLGGSALWMDCSNDYKSSTYKNANCGLGACSVAKAHCVSLCFSPPSPGCNNNTCRLLTKNGIRQTQSWNEISIDTISLGSTDGSKVLSSVSVPNFIFGCAENNWNLENVASGVNGMFGLSKERIALPNQLSSSFGGSFRRKFAICLPSNSKSNGVLFFGDLPYIFYPGYNTSKAIDVSSRFSYTKLHVNYEATASPRVQGALMPEYFVKITSILVNGKTVPVNLTLLNFHRTGFGGSTISTVQPFTVLHSSIYKSLVKVFDEEIAASNVTKVAPVAPFKDCYNVRNMAVAHLLGLSVPDVSLVFENKNVKWDIYGANSMVDINHDVACLGFLDGGSSTTASIVIGAHQLQDNLIQFDLASSRMAFTSTLLFEEVECSNFQF